MRAIGLLAVLLGVFALIVPTVRAQFPFLYAELAFLDSLGTDSLRIIGGCLIALGGAAVWLNRDG